MPNMQVHNYSLEEVIIMELLQHFNMAKRPREFTFHFVEGFSGCRSLSTSFIGLGLTGISLDKRYHESLDFATDLGFMKFLCAARCLRPGG
eukprot:3459715-Pyramimonas_sp.AAC.1